MGRRHDDPRPPIELIDVEPSLTTERPVVSPTRRAGPRRGRLPVVVALLIGSLVSVGLALGDDDGGAPAVLAERDNRARAALKGRSTTTTTDGEQQFAASSTTVPKGPVLDQPVGASLLLAGAGEAWTLVDLDTGHRERLSITADHPGHVVPVRNGVVVISNGRAVLRPLPGAAPIDLGPGEQALASGSPDRVWIVDGARGFDGQPPGADARLVDLGGAVLHRVALPVPYAGAATAEGLVFTQDDRTHLATPTGVSVIAPGPLLAAAGERVLYLACPLGCGPEAIDLTTGASVTYASTPDAGRYIVQAVLAADGRLAITSARSADDPGRLTVFSGDGRVVIETGGNLRQPPVWLPTDRGLLMADGSGRQRLSVDGDDPPQLTVIPALGGLPGVPYVIVR